MTGTLWLVATPIGNLGDLPPRAIEAIATAELVACEDTRRTAKLLTHAGIRAERLIVANDHTEHGATRTVVDVLAGGGDVVVVSDAGTPGVSDPGERLVAAAVAAGHRVSAVPGPAAAVMAVTISGLPTDRFVFEGFLPRSGRERAERLQSLVDETRTMVIYEAPHRIERTIADLTDVLGPDRPVAVCRELTKVYEEVVRSNLGDLDVGEPRGEYVVVVAGRSADDTSLSDADIADHLERALERGDTRRDAVRTVAELTGEPRNRVYEIMTSR